MKKIRIIMLAVVCMSLAVSSAVASPSGTQWVATHTKAIQLRVADLGDAPSSQQLRISVVLALHDRSEIDGMIQKLSTPGSPEYGQFLTPEQVARRFGPSASEVSSVTSYLRSQGFAQIAPEKNSLLVDSVATVASVERAFNTHIELYNVHGVVVHVNTQPAMVPAALGRIVVAVLGLQNLPMKFPLVRRPAASAPDTSGYHPRTIQHVYGADAMKPAGLTSIAIIASGDMAPTIQHLRQAEDAEHFPKPPVSVVYTLPKDLLTKDNPLTGSLEWDLDLQISTEMAGTVRQLYIYDIATWDDPDVARGINMFVAQNKALNLSASLGECDFLAFLDGAMITTDQSLQEGALQGQSMFASTGDNGFSCPEVVSSGAPGGVPGLSWPSDGEYTTAVGGTTLDSDAQGNVTQEIAWVGGGGGFSPYETAAPWTLHANPLGLSWQVFNQGGRGVPDVAAIADSIPSGVVVYDGSATPTQVGGTSVSSPLVMGLYSRIQGAHRNKLGLAQYNFYRKYNQMNPGVSVASVWTINAPKPPAAAVPGFRDIQVGTNGLYVAMPGYDYTTGIGVLDAATLSSHITN
ncbi:MAG: S53 family peptidase [Actinomycetota bacterium]